MHAQAYNARFVLSGPPGRGYTYTQTCGEEWCIAPEHQVLVSMQRLNVSRGRSRRTKHTVCLRCEAPMRPCGTSAEENPGTKAHQGHGLCSGCYRPHKTGQPGDWWATLELPDNYEPVVRRQVPRDLWTYFGVENAA